VFIHSSTRNFFYRNQQGDQFAIPPASGSGFVWDDFGHVVTNHHVIVWEDETEKGQGRPRREADDLQVTLADGKSYKAVVIGRSLALDIAVLHVFAPLGAMRPLPIGTSKDLKVGQDVSAIGNPFGLDHSLTAGIVSALGRDILTNFGTHITGAIQTDAAINPGNSGGPLLDRVGHLVGMNTAITSSSGASSGVGFAIPVDTLNKVVPLLIARGQNSRPTLGFLTLKDAILQEMGIQNAVAVAEVEPGGMADKAGLQGIRMREGAKEPFLASDYLMDLIVAVNGVEMKSEIQLMDYLELLPADTVLEFDILRDKKPMKIRLDPSAEIRLPSGPEVKS
jgi:S1-C subfamily serine protease